MASNGGFNSINPSWRQQSGVHNNNDTQRALGSHSNFSSRNNDTPHHTTNPSNNLISQSRTPANGTNGATSVASLHNANSSISNIQNQMVSSSPLEANNLQGQFNRNISSTGGNQLCNIDSNQSLMIKAGQAALQSRIEPILSQHKLQFDSSYQQIERAIASGDVTLIGITNQLVTSISQSLGYIQLESNDICQEIENAMKISLPRPVIGWKAQTLNEIVTSSIALEQQVQYVENELKRIQQLDGQLKEKSRSLNESETSLNDQKTKVNSQAEKLQGVEARLELREQSIDLCKLEQDRYKIINEQRKDELDQQKTILDDLKSANEQVQTSIRSQRDDLARREEELSRSKSSLEAAQARLRTQENEFKDRLRSQEAARTLEDDLEAAQSRLQTQDDELKAVHERESRLQTQVGDLMARLQSREDDLEAARERELRQQSLEDDLKARLQTQDDELKTARERESRLQSREDDLEARLQSKDDELKAVSERESRLQSQVSDLEARLQPQEDELKAVRERESRLQSELLDARSQIQSSRVRSSIQDVEAERIRNERDKVSREFQSSLVVRETNVREREDDVGEREEAVAELENNLKVVNADLGIKLNDALVRENELKDTIKEQTSRIQSLSSDQSSHRPRYQPDNLVMDVEKFKLAYFRVWGNEPSKKLLQAIKKMEKHVPVTSDFSDQPIPLQDKVAELLLLEENIHYQKLRSHCRQVDLMLAKRRFERPTDSPGFHADDPSQPPSFYKDIVLSLMGLKDLKEFEEALLGKASFGMKNRFVVRFTDGDHIKAMAELEHFNNTNYLDAFRSIQNKHNFMPQFPNTNSNVKGSTTLALTERVEDSDGKLWGHEIVAHDSSSLHRSLQVYYEEMAIELVSIVNNGGLTTLILNRAKHALKISKNFDYDGMWNEHKLKQLESSRDTPMEEESETESEPDFSNQGGGFDTDDMNEDSEEEEEKRDEDDMSQFTANGSLPELSRDKLTNLNKRLPRDVGRGGGVGGLKRDDESDMDESSTTGPPQRRGQGRRKRECDDDESDDDDDSNAKLTKNAASWDKRSSAIAREIKSRNNMVLVPDDYTTNCGDWDEIYRQLERGNIGFEVVKGLDWLVNDYDGRSTSSFFNRENKNSRYFPFPNDTQVFDTFEPKDLVLSKKKEHTSRLPYKHFQEVLSQMLRTHAKYCASKKNNGENSVDNIILKEDNAQLRRIRILMAAIVAIKRWIQIKSDDEYHPLGCVNTRVLRIHQNEQDKVTGKIRYKEVTFSELVKTIDAHFDRRRQMERDKLKNARKKAEAEAAVDAGEIDEEEEGA